MSSRPLRFAMVTTFYPPYHFGGDATYVRQLAQALARRGHEVEVLHDADAFRLLHRGGEPEPLPEPPGVRVHRLESRLPALACLATQQTGRPVVHGRRIRELLAAGRFDVIHYHNVSLLGGPAVWSYGDAVKLHTAHEHWLVCPTHILWRHDREPCTGRECGRCLWHHRRPPQLWRYTGWLERQARHVDAFLAPSRFCAEKHREFGFPRPMRVLPNFAADVHAAPPPEPTGGRAGETPYFLFVGRLDRIKGLEDVIPLFGEDAPGELWIAGQGRDEAALRRLAQGRPRVRFLGPRPPEELPALYAGARAAVVPSRCYEVFPMVLLEAFRAATPVVARRQGPFPEILEESGGGLLFGDRAELASALGRLAREPALRDRLGAEGRRAFRARWTERVVLGRYLELIGELAGARGRTGLAEAAAAARTADAA